MRSLVALLIVLTAAVGAPGDAASPAIPGRIVFASERGSTLDNTELYAVRVDGSGRRSLTRNPDGADVGARWSPDGRLLAFLSERPEATRQVRALYLLRADGRALRRLTPRWLVVTSDFDAPPSWSPDGRALAFSGERRSRPGIWTVQADGRGLRRVAGGGTATVWSPRGDLLVYVAFGRVFVVPARGGAARRLTRGPNDGAPAWSPDGRKVAFVRSDANGASQGLHVIAAGGGALRQIVGGLVDMGDPHWSPDGRLLLVQARSQLFVARVRERRVRRLRAGEWPAWSPDGRRIAFIHGSRLYLMNADGSRVRRVRGERGFDFWGRPAWSPDGRTLVYSISRAKSDLEIFVVGADGSRLRQLTHNSVHDWGPAWSPERRRIAFVRRGAIWVMSADGSGPRRLIAGTEPSWSPPGSQLAYTSGGRVFVVSVRGGTPTQVTEGHSPAWSPRRAEIAFVRGLRVMTVDLRSSTERTLIDNASTICPARTFESSLYGPDWSPDGRRLVYAVACDDGRFVSVAAEVVEAGGGGRRLLPLDELGDSRLAWSPNGLRVAFVSEAARLRLGTAKLDGSGRTTVVADTGGGAYLDPDW